MTLFSCCDWSKFQDFHIEWLIDLWPILHLVPVLQEVQDLLSLLWSHCIHLGLENQYLHLDLGGPDTQAHVISLTSDPLLASPMKTCEQPPKKYLTGTPSMPGKPGTPTLPWNQKKSHIFPVIGSSVITAPAQQQSNRTRTKRIYRISFVPSSSCLALVSFLALFSPGPLRAWKTRRPLWTLPSQRTRGSLQLKKIIRFWPFQIWPNIFQFFFK